MSVHRMRLRGPWQVEWLGPPPPDGRPAPGPIGGQPGDCERGPWKVAMPAEWRELFGTASGRARFRRRFHRPTNLEPHERVFLVFDGVGGHADVSLNGHPLGSTGTGHETAAFDVTPLLEPSNEVIVDLDFTPSGPPPRGGLWGLVALEVHGGRQKP